MEQKRILDYIQTGRADRPWPDVAMVILTGRRPSVNPSRSDVEDLTICKSARYAVRPAQPIAGPKFALGVCGAPAAAAVYMEEA